MKYAENKFKNDSTEQNMPISPDRWQDLSRIDMMDDNKRHYDTPLLVNIKGNRSPFLKTMSY